MIETEIGRWTVTVVIGIEKGIEDEGGREGGVVRRRGIGSEGGMEGGMEGGIDMAIVHALVPRIARETSGRRRRRRRSESEKKRRRRRKSENQDQRT